MSYDPALCNYFWGSHGCDLGADHQKDGQPNHTCSVLLYLDDEDETQVREVCCQHNGNTHVRWSYDGVTLGEWKEYGAGWYGT